MMAPISVWILRSKQGIYNLLDGICPLEQGEVLVLREISD